MIDGQVISHKTYLFCQFNVDIFYINWNIDLIGSEDIPDHLGNQNRKVIFERQWTKSKGGLAIWSEWMLYESFDVS